MNYPTRWLTRYTSTKGTYMRCINTHLTDSVILDFRLAKAAAEFIPRLLTKTELNKAFGYPPKYVQTNIISHYSRLYGMTVVPPVIVHILEHLFLKSI